jgi:transcriptional regulator with XRE-family HTH domain
LTLSEVAKKTGITASTLSKTERRWFAQSQIKFRAALCPQELYVTVVKDPNDPQAKGSIVMVHNVD